MMNNSAVMEDEAVPPIEPEMLSELKKQDMQQAVVERFKAKGPSGNERKRSPLRPLDRKC
jgi:hypothetical protein